MMKIFLSILLCKLRQKQHLQRRRLRDGVADVVPSLRKHGRHVNRIRLGYDNLSFAFRLTSDISLNAEREECAPFLFLPFNTCSLTHLISNCKYTRS